MLELAVDGSVIAMTPTGSETGARNSKFLFQLKLYANRVGRWKVFDSSSGFWLPDGSVVSPDTSLVRLDRWQALSTAERRSFVPLCPVLVVELASTSDEGPWGLSALRQKMASYSDQRRPAGLAAAAPAAGRGGVARQWWAETPGAD